MATLGQQQMETPPARRVEVKPGRTAWWGIDPSTRTVALGAIVRRSDGILDRMAKTAEFPTAEGAPRLTEIRETTYEWILSVAACCTWPGIVVVEQPGGQHHNWPLYFAVGVIIEAVHSALLEVTGDSVLVETRPPASWKKVACGRGNIYKPKRGGPEYGVLTWARANGYSGHSWDEADALGLAECARREVGLQECAPS